MRTFFKTLLIVNLLIGVACLFAGAVIPLSSAAAVAVVMWPGSGEDDA